MACVVSSKHKRCSAPDIKLPVCENNKRKIVGFTVYHYDEMIERLNNVSEGEIGLVVYLLRKLWHRHNNKPVSDFVIHETDVYSNWHEQKQKASKSEFEKKYRKKEIGFYEDSVKGWGAHSDLLYDTYQKDWSKAYQLTFYCFFSNMDYLSNPKEGKFYSPVYSDSTFCFVNPDKTSSEVSHVYYSSQFGKVIEKDVKNLNDGKLNEIRNLQAKQDKAPLCEIIGGVLYNGKYTNKDGDQFGRDKDFWLGNEGNEYDNLLRCLATEFFAHMCAAAVVNHKAFKMMMDCLPNSYEMFKDILDTMVLNLKACDVDMYKNGKRYYKLPSLTMDNPLSIPIFKEIYPDKSEEEIKRMDKIRIMNQGFPDNIIDKIKGDINCAKKYVEFRERVILIAQHHLYMTEKANSREKEYYELTYVSPHFCGKHYERNNEYSYEVYKGYYDYEQDEKIKKEKGHTMGPEFGNLVKQHDPDTVIHLHPLVDDTGNPRREKPCKTMFSEGDQRCFLRALWIGIQPFKEHDNKYYVDIYVSKKNWGLVEDDYESIKFSENVETVTPGMHMERIGGLTPKYCDNFEIYEVTKDKVGRCE